MFIAAFFAAILWLFVTLRLEYQEKIQLPLQVVNVRSGFAVKSPLPNSITLRINASGWRLAMMRWMKETPFVLDGSALDRGTTIELEKLISRMITLPADVQVLDINPDLLHIEIEQKITKKIPVLPDLDLKLRDGYITVGNITAVPDSVEVTGARSVVEEFRDVTTQKIIMKDVYLPIHITAVLQDTFEVPLTFSDHHVDLAYDVQPYAEKVLNRIPIELTEVPSNRTVILLPSVVDITVRGGVSQLALLTESEIAASIQYRAILADTTGVIKPVLSTPSWAEVVAVKPDRIQYVIRRK